MPVTARARGLAEPVSSVPFQDYSELTPVKAACHLTSQLYRHPPRLLAFVQRGVPIAGQE